MRVLADPPSGTPGDANGDGTRSSSQDEFVELANVSSDPVDLQDGNWEMMKLSISRFPMGT